MKKSIFYLCAFGLFFQSCHIGLGQAGLTHLIPETFETKEKVLLPAGTPVFLSCNQAPLMKEVRASQILIFKTSRAVSSKDGNILIAEGSNGIAKIVRVESKGRTAPDVVTLQLECVSASDGQMIALKSEPVTISVNLYDREALLLKKGFGLSGVIPTDVMIQF